jgi:C1A family cysteine protease
MAYKIQRYGWKPDLPDHRDQMFAAPIAADLKLPAKVDLRPQCPKTIYDQGQLGSCTANAIAKAVEFDLLRQKRQDFMPSRLFIYYNERATEGTVQEDSGAMIRDGIKSVAKLGVCSEKTWPYSDKNPGPFQEKPSAAAVKEALGCKATTYQRLPRTLRSFQARLASGFPFVFGFTVYETFESPEVAKTGEVPMPRPQEKMLGGHAVLAVGYDDGSQRFTVCNSWGPQWGQHGYFTMPYAYLLDENLADDFWTIVAVTA